MSELLQTVRLTSEAKYGGKVPPHAVGSILRVLPVAVDRSVRMGFSGRSAQRGKPPEWLKAISDMRFLALDADRGDTLLRFALPSFGEAAPELYEQGELWPTRPPPEDTGFDLLGDVLADVWAMAQDSERFDRPLLQSLRSFRGGFSEGFTGLYLSGHRYTAERPAVLTPETLERAARLDEETPPPQRVRVAGRLDMIWKSRQVFLLELDDGERVGGVLVEGDVAALTALFSHRVVVHGRAVYRPSGRLLRIDADLIEDGAGEPGIWSRIPPPRSRTIDKRQLSQPQTSNSGVGAIFGQWPGDESEEEILEALKRMG